MADRITLVLKCEQWLLNHNENDAMCITYESVKDLLNVLKEKPEIVYCRDCSKMCKMEDPNGFCSEGWLM